MKRTVFETPLVQPVLRALSVAFLRVTGFRVDGGLPDAPKYVVVAAPHTSNWDVVFLLAMAITLRVNARWFAKHTLFRWPLTSLFRWLGGIPIERGRPTSRVSQYVEAFAAHDRFVLAMAPEGTRKKAPWKSGFYRIAVGAGVPIALAYLDYRRKAGGIGLLLHPTGDYEADLKIIQAFYATITAKYPDQTG